VKTSFTLAPGHPAFEGHFPGRPLVPAVSLLAEVMAAVEAATATLASAWTLSSAKFLAPTGPGAQLTLAHEETPAGRRFEIRAGDTLVASGTLSRQRP
jgi:3-hydroxymyristoyl/3-hydroxydecanoyl-(acyl carrier protein) dehydratase